MSVLPHQTCRDRAWGAGFTIVELLLVIAIVGIIASGTVAAIHGRTQLQASRLAAKDVASAIRYAIAEARSQGTTCRVIFEAVDRTRYRVEQWQSDTNQFAPVAGVAGRWHVLADGVSVQTQSQSSREDRIAASTLEFAADGTGFTGAIFISCADQDPIRLSVPPGGNQVGDGEPEANP